MLAVALGCSRGPEADPPGGPDPPATTSLSSRLRIKNHGPLPIRGLTVAFPSERLEFGDVPAGVTTEYQDVQSGVFPYAVLLHQHQDRIVGNSITDFAGVRALERGAYTYEVTVEPGGSDVVTRISKVVEDR